MFKKILILFSLLSTTAFLLSSAHASEFETLLLNASLRVEAAQTRSVRLSSPQYIKKIIVQAEGLRFDSVVEIMVNGDIKGTIYAPGTDPSYVVTLEAYTSSIEFRHRTGGAMNIISVFAVFENPNPAAAIYEDSATNRVESLTRKAIAIVNRLAPYSSLNDEDQYLLPIKLKAGDAQVMARVHGELSITTRTALEELQAQIEISDPYIRATLEQYALFDLAVELLVVKESISELLD